MFVSDKVKKWPLKNRFYRASTMATNFGSNLMSRKQNYCLKQTQSFENFTTRPN